MKRKYDVGIIRKGFMGGKFNVDTIRKGFMGVGVMGVTP